MATDDSSYSSDGSDTSSQPLSRERVKFLSSNSGNSSSGLPNQDPSFKCFSVSNLKKKVMARLCQTTKRMDNGGSSIGQRPHVMAKAGDLGEDQKGNNGS
ncbi:hypothetical protein ACFX11_030604 [Malus domestica]